MKRIFVISILCLTLLAGNAYSAKKTKEPKPKKIKEKAVIASVNPVTPESQIKLATMYLKGEQVKQSYGKAKKWFFNAAMAGNLVALESLGEIYKNGNGGWNYKKLFKTLNASAQKGDAKVYTNVGYCWRGGFGVKRSDYNEAVKWFGKSANAGQGSGMFYMGWMTYNGFGTTQNYAEAMNWYSKAALVNYADAQHALANLYMESPAVKQDYVEAYKWLLLAEKNGGDVFEDKYLVGKKLNAAQTADAKTKANAFGR
ncbi:MAG: sel1 repeat family protein [Planctomycetaceae bacterium]|nr:sel1 repeat family protein [Planctomycetaceae bacterium]